MLSPLDRLPESWFTDVTVLRSGGRDPKGNPMPDTEIPVAHCLVAPRSTSDPVDRSDVVETREVLYHKDFVFFVSDKIRVPKGARMAGLWAVDGRPAEWPFGVEVGLVRS